MPQAPAADQRRLLDVQDADTRIAQAQHRRNNLEVLSSIAELEARLADLEQARGLAVIEVSDIKRELSKAEDDVAAVRARAERDTQRLNSGQGTPRDLQALQSEVELLVRRQSTLEDAQMEVMERLEAAQGRQASAAVQVDAIQTQLSGLIAERDQQFAEIDSEVAQLSAARASAADGLDAGLIALYERLRAAGGGVGAASLVHGQCQGCHMKLTPVDLNRIAAAPADEVVRCEECGRILIRGDRA